MIVGPIEVEIDVPVLGEITIEIPATELNIDLQLPVLAQLRAILGLDPDATLTEICDELGNLDPDDVDTIIVNLNIRALLGQNAAFVEIIRDLLVDAGVGADVIEDAIDDVLAEVTLEINTNILNILLGLINCLLLGSSGDDIRDLTAQSINSAATNIATNSLLKSSTTTNPVMPTSSPVMPSSSNPTIQQQSSTTLGAVGDPMLQLKASLSPIS